jgi:putative transposase
VLTSTMYRLLRAQGETGDRRRHATHPARVKPELLATAPNQVWWDITKLAGPAKPVCGRLDGRRSRGRPTGRAVAGRHHPPSRDRRRPADRPRRPGHLDDLQAGRSAAGRSGRHQEPFASPHQRRQPYSESQFKTLKHHPTFPDRFGSIQDARGFCQQFFAWYNVDHYHSGIALLTPADVHYGHAEQIITARAAVLEGAYAAYPERFVRKPPTPLYLPEQVWINKPADPSEPPQQFPAELSHRG